MKYKATLQIPDWEKQDYQKRGRWPLEINGIKFTEETVYETGDLMELAANPRHPYKVIDGKKTLYTDPRLKIEVIDVSDSEATD